MIMVQQFLIRISGDYGAAVVRGRVPALPVVMSHDYGAAVSH